jgi:hypothetical protein
VLVGLPVVPVVIVRKTGTTSRATKSYGCSRSGSFFVIGIRAISSVVSAVGSISRPRKSWP